MRISSRLTFGFALAAGSVIFAACGGHSNGVIPTANPGNARVPAVMSASRALQSSVQQNLATASPAPGAPAIKEYATTTPGSGPVDIIVGPDGALWFSEYNVNQIGRITTAGVVTNEYPVTGSAGAGPYGMVVGPDGNIWFTEYNTAQIAKISTAGTVTQVPVTLSGINPAFIDKGPDNALWFTEYNGGAPGKIGRVTTGGSLSEYSDGAGPWDIVSGPGSTLWFAESGSSSIGRMTTSGTLTNQYPTKQAGAFPYNIAVGPDGAVWFTECASFGDPASPNKDSIGRVTTAGVVTEYPVPTNGSCPNGITAAPDGNMWFAENGYIVGTGASAIGKITMAGAITEYPLTNTTAGPQMIHTGPDGNLWFTEYNAGVIGEVVLNTGSGSGSGSGSGCDKDKHDGGDRDKDKKVKKDDGQDNHDKHCCKSKPNDKDKGHDKDNGCAD